MPSPVPTLQFPVYSLEPDLKRPDPNFRVYNFEGVIPAESEFLIPHRKDHYLLVFTRSGSGRQWVDMKPYVLKPGHIYFSGLNQVIVKEEFNDLFSTGIAFTPTFLAMQENQTIAKLPMMQNTFKGFELPLDEYEILFIENQLSLINEEYSQPGEWQQRMLTAHLTVLLTYISRLFTRQSEANIPSAERVLLNRFHEQVNENFRELHEVADYAPLMNLSAGHLSESIKSQSGRPAIKHIHERLALEARRLLFHTDQSLKEIAWELGFTDASYFNRFFKRETGSTPAGFRTSIRKMYH